MSQKRPEGFEWVAGVPLRSRVAAAKRPEGALLPEAELGRVPLQLAVRRLGKITPQSSTARDTNPFVPLTLRCRHSRPLLGRIAAEGGETLREVAIKIARDRYLPSESKFPSVAIHNPQIDATWQRERRAMQLARGPHVAHLHDLGVRKDWIGPTAFCLERRQFVEVVPPARGATLEVCRDDELLRDSGLEAYGESHDRYLHQPGESEQRFWTWDGSAAQRARPGVEVGRQTAIYAAAAPRILSEDEDADLVAHPCRLCPHRKSCYTDKIEGSDMLLAEARLVPLSFYGSELLIVELMDLHYDELVDTLGGADPAKVLRSQPMETALRARLVDRLEQLGESEPYAFHRDREHSHALEVLHLKLTAFTQLCRGVQAIHEKMDAPHLGISPDNVMARMDCGLGDVPSRWRFEVKLIDLGSRVELDFDPGAQLDLPKLSVPEPQAHKAFVSPQLDPGDFSNEAALQLAGRAVSVQNGKAAQIVESLTRSLEFRGCAVGDLVRILPYVPVPELGSGPFYGVVDKVDEDRPSFRLRLTTKEHKFPAQFEAGVTLYRNYRAPCDLYSLGRMLLRTLLVNDRHDMVWLEETSERILARVGARLAAEDAPTSEEAEAQLRQELRSSSLHSSMILYRSEDRELYADSIPESIWSELLVFAFRSMATHPSLALEPGYGAPAEQPHGALLRRIVRNLGRIHDRVRIELFAAAARERDIGSVCRDLLTEVNERLLSEGAEE